jgi:putative hydrolase of HD superfamily
MINDRLEHQIDFIIQIDKAKQVLRQTALADGSRQENDAEHSWHIGIMAFILAEYANEKNLDMLRVLKMLLIHDLVEVIAGDTFLYDRQGVENQSDRELKASEEIFGLLPDDQREHLQRLWQEFEYGNSKEAQYARAMDALQPVLLAIQNGGWSWKKHGISETEVIEQKTSMQYGSETLWEFCKQIIREAKESGFFP